MDPVEGVAGGDHHLPPHRRAVHVGERNPQLEYRVAWLGHAADPADRVLAVRLVLIELGECSRVEVGGEWLAGP